VNDKRFLLVLVYQTNVNHSTEGLGVGN